MSKLYRQAALDKLSSPDQLDKSITIISPSFWLVAIGSGVIIAIALIWSIVGRLPVNVTVSGIYMGTAGVGGVASESSGIVDEVYVEESEYVKKGQKLLHLDTKTTEEEVNSLKERKANVESVTFDSDNDTLTADNKSLADIKAQRILADSNLKTNKSVLEAKKKELADQTAKTETAKKEYETARNSYLASMGALNTSGEQLGLQDAQSSLNEAKSKLSTAESTYQSAVTNLNQYYQQRDNIINAIAAAEQKYYEAAEVMQNAYDAMASAQERQMNAQAQLDEALMIQTMAEEELQAAQSDVESAEAAQHVEQAKQAVEEARAVYSEAASSYNEAVVTYDSASNTASSLEQSLSGYNSNLSSLEAQIQSLEGTVDTSLRDIEDYGSWVDNAQSDYYNAEYNYIQAMGEQASKQSDNNKASTAYSAAYQEYNTMLSLQRNLETTILQLEAQVNADQSNLDHQNSALKLQFDSSKASILNQLDQEIDSKEKLIKAATVTANIDGKLVSLNVAVGSAVQTGSVVCRISTDQDNATAVVCYVPVGEGRKIKEGMTVAVYPSTVNKQEYGHMEGKVIDVSDFVSSSEEMVNQLGDSSLAQAFQQNGPVVKVICTLTKDENTVSGYKWSSKKGSKVELADGTIVTADIVTEEIAPISKLIPYLKEKFTIRKTKTSGS